MPILFKGAGPATHNHRNDARIMGFQAREPALECTVERILQHIARGSGHSPVLSASHSYAVARGYGLAGKRRATAKEPGYVYELELPGDGPLLIDPLVEIAKSLPEPWSGWTYHHDGPQEFIHAVMDPRRFRHLLRAAVPQPPPYGGAQRPANLSIQLEAIARVIRDAEVLIYGHVPKQYVKARYAVY